MRRSPRATRSTSSTKSTCCRRTRSTRLLKTLEEPPPHVKFLFATTEVNKVPVTVLSRCQRFDLRRIPAEMLAAHFAAVAEAEGVEAEPEALALIARAAEGSVRDGLSILDQAIAHRRRQGHRATQVRDDARPVRSRRDPRLFGLMLAGDAPGALAALREQYDLGVDPRRCCADCWRRSTASPAPRSAAPPIRRNRPRSARRYAEWAARLGLGATPPAVAAAAARAWRGRTTRRCRSKPPRWRCCASSTPPSCPIRARCMERLASGEAVAAAPRRRASAPAEDRRRCSRCRRAFPRWSSCSARAARPISRSNCTISSGCPYAPPELVVRPRKPLAADFLRDLAVALKALTGTAWQVRRADEAAAPSLLDQEKQAPSGCARRCSTRPWSRPRSKPFPTPSWPASLDEQRSA